MSTHYGDKMRGDDWLFIFLDRWNDSNQRDVFRNIFFKMIGNGDEYTDENIIWKDCEFLFNVL